MSWSFRLIIISPLLLLGLIFVVLRLHINIFWNWALIFIPFWVALLVWIFIDVHGLVVTKDGSEYGLYIVSGLGAVLVALFLAFIAVKEQLEPGWPWTAVISPLWAAMLMYCILLLTHRVIGTHTLLLGMTYLCIIPASIVIAIRLDASPTATISSVNWGILFIPIWVLLAVWLVALIVAVATKLRKDPSRTVKKPYWTNVYVLSLMWIGLVTFMILLTLELQSPGSIGFLFVFTPMIIVLAAVFIGPYILLATRRKIKMREKYIPWLTGLTPGFADMAAPTDLKTGKPMWKVEQERITAECPNHQTERGREDISEDPDAPLNFIKRANARASSDSN